MADVLDLLVSGQSMIAAASTQREVLAKSAQTSGDLASCTCPLRTLASSLEVRIAGEVNSLKTMKSVLCLGGGVQVLSYFRGFAHQYHTA